MEKNVEEYRPSVDEPYMNERQIEFFRHQLQELRRKTQKEYEESFSRIKEEKTRDADMIDQGSLETDIQMDFYARERALGLLEDIETALAKIEEGTYGYCEESGEEIGLRRLMARPLATLGIEAQEKREQQVKMQRGAARI